MVCSSSSGSPSAIRKRGTFSFNGGSDGLAAQEGRNIENLFLGRILHGGDRPYGSRPCGAALRAYSEAGVPSSFGVAGRWALLRWLGLGQRRIRSVRSAMRWLSLRSLPTGSFQCTFPWPPLMRRTGVIDTGRDHRDADDAI